MTKSGENSKSDMMATSNTITVNNPNIIVGIKFDVTSTKNPTIVAKE